MVKYYAKDSNKKQRNCQCVLLFRNAVYSGSSSSNIVDATLLYTMDFSVHDVTKFGLRMPCLGDFVDPR